MQGRIWLLTFRKGLWLSLGAFHPFGDIRFSNVSSLGPPTIKAGYTLSDERFTTPKLMASQGVEPQNHFHTFSRSIAKGTDQNPGT